jgi:hypothetical protein
MRAIAAEVQQITGSSEEDTRIVLQHLGAIDESLAAISSQCSTSSGATLFSRSPEEVREEVSGLAQVVKASSKEVSGQLVALLERSGSLKTELHSTCAVAGRGSLLTRRFDELLQRLDEYLQNSGYQPETALSSDQTGTAANLMDMYSMQSERDVHQQLFGGDPQQDATNTDDLGDDVELF